MRGKRAKRAPGSKASRATLPRLLQSAAFRRRLGRVIQAELGELGSRTWGEVVDDAAVRKRIRAWSIRLADREALAELLINRSRAAEQRLRAERRSLVEVLGGEAAADLENMLNAALAVPADLEPLARRLVGQELVRRLLTDLIFTAIDGFYRRVNPLFGAMTTRMLEDQIKGFIGLFMPTLQRQAVAFLGQRANQRLAQDLLRTAGREIVRQPLSRLAELLPAAQRRETDAALRRALRSRQFDTNLRRLALAAWDDLSGGLADKRIDEIVPLDRLAPWLTETLLAGLDAAFAHSRIAAFLADEIALALGPRRSDDTE